MGQTKPNINNNTLHKTKQDKTIQNIRAKENKMYGNMEQTQAKTNKIRQDKASKQIKKLKCMGI